MRYSCAAYSVVILAGLLRHASLESAPVRERCPRPRLKYGWVKVRSHGRIAKFSCNREYQLFGEKFATCLGGEWDNPPPLCVRPGCEELNLSNGQMMQTYRGAVLTFFCNPGYRLEGIAKLYCDGVYWNGTAPQCTAISSDPAVSCDFETEDLCGWTQDPHHHFNWTRMNHYTPSAFVGTGPSYDHTLGKGKDGYYLYIETSGPRKQNDTARLYSPVYGTEVVASQPSCFTFWYHMYGATVGSLAVYIKPDNQELSSDLEAGFFQSGNKGDVWLNGIVNIPPMPVPFQIIIEAVRGPGYVGDTAIDDVRLANGSDCEQPTTDLVAMTTFATHKLSTEGAAVTMGSSRPSRTYPTPPPLPPLEPHPLENSTQMMTTTEDVFRPIPIPPDPTPLILNLPTRAPPPTLLATTSTTKIFPTTVQGLIVAATTNTTTTTTTVTTSKTPTTKTITTTVPTTKNLTIFPTTAATKTTVKRPIIFPTTAATKTTVKRPIIFPTTAATTTTIKRPIIFPTTAVTKTTVERPMIFPTTAATKTTVKRPIIFPTTAATKTTVKRPIIFPTTTTTKTTVKSPIVFPTTTVIKTTVKKPMVTAATAATRARTPLYERTETSTTRQTTPTTAKPRPSFRTTRLPTTTFRRSSTWRHNTMRSILDDDVQGKDWKTVPREPLMQSDQSVPISLIAGISGLVATVVVVSILVSIFIRQRRKSRSQQNLAEDSDVRFLTADEILDFTLARPREEDYDSN